MRITKAIDRYARIQAEEIKRLKGPARNAWRLRMEWRMFYMYESVARTIVVARVVHRSQAH